MCLLRVFPEENIISINRPSKESFPLSSLAVQQVKDPMLLLQQLGLCYGFGSIWPGNFHMLQVWPKKKKKKKKKERERKREKEKEKEKSISLINVGGHNPVH